jgi:hypothetical protein
MEQATVPKSYVRSKTHDAENHNKIKLLVELGDGGDFD